MKPKTLHEALKKAKIEEDVKDAYIKAIGLNSFTKGLSIFKRKKFGLKQKISSAASKSLGVLKFCSACSNLKKAKNQNQGKLNGNLQSGIY